MTVDLRAASSFEADELAALFTRAYEGYFVPMQVDEEALRFLVRAFDLDDDEPVGLVNLGIRGERGWIGGLGVVSRARRRGIGRMLMEAVHEEARARGIRELSLEVIEANEAAFRLYEELGYGMTRWLEIGSLDSAPGEAPPEEAWQAAHERIRASRSTREPWQRDDDTLRHYDDLRGLAAGDGAAVYRVTPEGRIVVLQFAGDQPAARETLEALRTLGAVSVFNVSEGGALVAALEELGGSVVLRQRELAFRL